MIPTHHVASGANGGLDATHRAPSARVNDARSNRSSDACRYRTSETFHTLHRSFRVPPRGLPDVRFAPTPRSSRADVVRPRSRRSSRSRLTDRCRRCRCRRPAERSNDRSRRGRIATSRIGRRKLHRYCVRRQIVQTGTAPSRRATITGFLTSATSASLWPTQIPRVQDRHARVNHFHNDAKLRHPAATIAA